MGGEGLPQLPHTLMEDQQVCQYIIQIGDLMNYTRIQLQRLVELGDNTELEICFPSNQERDSSFRQLERKLIQKNKAILQSLREKGRPELRLVENMLVKGLTEQGFIEVLTPVMMSRGMLEKMGLREEMPLWRQIFWVDEKKCLRPMLAPHLYHILRRLKKHWGEPLKIFEVGPCFRKESKGSNHIEEFTMLNLVCLGCSQPLLELQETVKELLGPFDLSYHYVEEKSEVYGHTVDITHGEIELASAAVGPHQLDQSWDISGSWYGLGIGLERFTMVLKGYRNIRRVGRSLSYQDGARLNF